MAGLYLHIPFCKQACYYCDFHFSTSRENQPLLIDAICREIELQKDYLGNELLETIYFGGGTPSVLNENELDKIFESIHKNFKTAKDAEITLEANPDDLNIDKLLMLKRKGVNRLSIGIQSFNDEVLKFMNRAHTSAQAFNCIGWARESGFDNISIDLIYAIPDQDNDDWKKNIERAIALSPEHISAYSLTIEEKTVFGNWQKKGKLKMESDEVAASQMEILMEKLSEAGYLQYEISNFCKPNFYSRHNSSYWRQEKYLGVGPSAHSYNVFSRQHNVRNNSLYIQSINQGKVPFELEVLSLSNQINEYLFTTLRTSWGCNALYILDHYKFDLLSEKKAEIDQFEKLGLLQRKENVILLTPKGKLLADKIAADLFVD